MSMNDALGALEVASLALMGYVLTKPVRLIDAQRDALRVAASTTLIITGTLHLALRLHLVA